VSKAPLLSAWLLFPPLSSLPPFSLCESDSRRVYCLTRPATPTDGDPGAVFFLFLSFFPPTEFMMGKN